MKVETGKRYKTRGGKKTGPLMAADAGTQWYTFLDEASGLYYGENGEVYTDGRQSVADLIAEWPDETGPVRTVTRREIVPGVYGDVEVWNDLSVSATDMKTASELRAAAATLIEIADALEDGNE